MNRIAKQWSYSTGERNRNRVRAFAHQVTGGLFLEFSDGGRRRRIALGHRDHEAAKVAAEDAARALRLAQRPNPGPIRLGTLFDIYVREVTPQKGRSARNHDERAVTLFETCWGRDRVVETLSRRDWDRFVQERRARGDRRKGAMAAGRPIGNRVIVQNLKFLLAVLHWAEVAGDVAGRRLIERNPLKGMPMPKELGTRRPILLEEEYQQMLSAAGSVDMQCPLLLELVHETGHRISAVLQARWSDYSREGGTMRWRGENDKLGFDHETPLSPDAVLALDRAWKRRGGIGDGWIFPAPASTETPVSRHLARTWWRRMETAAGLERVPGRGWHSLRRKFATELKTVPLTDLSHLGGWKGPQTILKCYQQPDAATLRRALEGRGTLHRRGLAPNQSTQRSDTSTPSPRTRRPA